MTTEAGAWALLGIARTSDETEIRRAYSRRLKAIDPDSDPQAFIALREARDLLMHLAGQAAQCGEPGAVGIGQPPAGEPSVGQPDRALPETPAPPEVTVRAAAPAPDAPPEAGPEERIDPALFETIDRILFRDQGPPDEDELERATLALLAHPAMERIDTAAGVEGWLARAIIEGRPRSDVMIEPTVSRFGWDNMADDWRRPQALDIIQQRRADREFEAILLRDHPRYRPIFALLRRKEPPGLFTRLRRTADMHAFLAYTWSRHPTTMETFDPDALAYWEKRVFQPSGLVGKFDNWRQGMRGDNDGQRLVSGRKNSWAAIFVGLVVLSIFFRIVAGGDPPGGRHGPGPLRNAEQDLAQPLDKAFGAHLDLAQLNVLNPVLHDRLRARWARAKQRGEPRQAFERDVEQIIDQAYRNGLRGSDYSVLSDYWRLQLRRLIALRDGPGGTGACGEQLRGGPLQTPPPMDFIVAEREIRARAVGVIGPPIASSGVHAVPQAIARPASRTTGLDAAGLLAAMEGRATPAARCTATIAVLQTALALPQEQSADFLRRMLN